MKRNESGEQVGGTAALQTNGLDDDAKKKKSFCASFNHISQKIISLFFHPYLHVYMRQEVTEVRV